MNSKEHADFQGLKKSKNANESKRDLKYLETGQKGERRAPEWLGSVCASGGSGIWG